VIGALGGAGANYIFAEHFQELGQAHLTFRKLERISVTAREFELGLDARFQ
jgi:hypothetical protein